MSEKILHLTLKKKWFDLIKSGEKKEEYREIKQYFITRLQGRTYDFIIFRNGYSKTSPKIKVKYLGVQIKMIINPMTEVYQSVFAIQLGKILPL
jgi:ASC-1-like (ASCH) protein